MTAVNHCRNARLLGDRLTPITANHILIVSQGERSAGQAAGSGGNGKKGACQSRSKPHAIKAIHLAAPCR